MVIFYIPGGFNYASSTNGGIYRDDRNQIFWKLGNLKPDSKGLLTLKIEVPWGIPLHQKITSFVDLAARNIASSTSVDDYLSYIPVEVISEKAYTEGEVSSLLASDQKLKELFDYALSLGYVFENVAKRYDLSDGSSPLVFVFLNPQQSGPVFLKKVGETVFMEKYEGTAYSLFDKSGGFSSDSNDGSFKGWGTWAETHSQSEDRCISNCLIQNPTWSRYISTKSFKQTSRSCIACQQAIKAEKTDPANCAECARLYLSINGKNHPAFAKGIAKCLADCKANYNSWQCQLGQFSRYCDSAILWGIPYSGVFWLTCNEEGGGTRWVASVALPCVMTEFCIDTPYPHCAFLCGQEGQKSPGDYGAANLPVCEPYVTPLEAEVSVSHDPNAKSIDFKGNVIPGQKLTYTIEYENLGEGTAYGVFILDNLDPNLDETTLEIKNGGTYSSASRLLSWDIGTLASKGKGSVTFSVKVKSGLPSGTAITNLAEVYFPSANEITPTNPAVNTVKAITADPKTLETTSEAATPITLSGRDTGSNPLTYRITQPPSYGTITGTPPNITYISMDDFSGGDEFYYVVNNGLIDSDPARVVLKVNPSPADTNPPTVVNTYPKAGGTKVQFDPNPVSTNPDVYRPSLSATFSEPIDATTVTASTFTVSGGMTGTVTYDEQTWTASFIPSKALAPSTTYTVKLAKGIKDKAGNAMAGEYSWQFTTESPANIMVTLPDDAAEVNFGDVLVNLVSAEKVVSVQNTGTLNLVLGTITKTGANVGDFKITEDKCSGKTLAQSENCTVKVAFQPLSPGSRSASLSIPSNDSDTPTASVMLRGKGAGPGIGVTPLSLSFGSAPVGGSADRTVTVSSVGTGALTLGTIGQPSAPFNRSGGTCADGQVLASGSSCTVIIRFAPTSGGSFNSSFSITSNDPEKPSVTVSVSGTGGAPDIMVGPRELSYGKVMKGSSLDMIITVSNEGTAPLILSAIGAPAPPFSITPGGTCTAPSTLTPGSTCSVKVRFSPTVQGTASSKFDIASNDPDEGSVTVQLSGEGALFAVSPKEGTYGSLLTITGSGFGGKKGKVTVGEKALKVMDWSSSTIHGSMTNVGWDWETPLDVVVTPAEPRGAKPITESGVFTVRQAEITGGPYHGSPGATVTVTGKFFTTLKGKVLLGATSCKVAKWVMNTATGESTASFVVPTKITKGPYELVIITSVGTVGIDEFKVD